MTESKNSKPENNSGTRASNAIDTRLYVASAEKCLKVLSAFRNSTDPMSLTEISQASGIGLSAVQRFVYTLKVLNYINQDKSTKRYAPTSKVLDLSYAYLSNSELIVRSAPFIREAHRQTNETINLLQLDGTEVVYLFRIASRNAISVDMTVGAKLPAHSSAGGWAMMAHLSADQVSALIAASDLTKRTPYSSTETSQILEKLQGIREVGYAVNNQEAFIGDLTVAAPIFDRSGAPIAAVNIALKTPRWTCEKAIEQCAPVIIETALAITNALN